MLAWIASACTFVSMFLIGRQQRVGWLVGLFAQIFWVWFALQVHSTGLLFFEVVFIGLVSWNWFEWRKR